MCFLFACLGSHTHLCGSFFRTLGTPQWVRERVGGDAADLRKVPPEQAHAWPTSCFRIYWETSSCANSKSDKSLLLLPTITTQRSQAHQLLRQHLVIFITTESRKPCQLCTAGSVLCIYVIGIAQHKMILSAFALKRIAQADVSLAIYACMSLNDLTSGGAWNFQAYACHLNYFNSSPRSAISWDGHWQLHNIHPTDMPALGRQQIHAVRTESELTKASCHLFTILKRDRLPLVTQLTFVWEERDVL